MNLNSPMQPAGQGKDESAASGLMAELRSSAPAEEPGSQEATGAPKSRKRPSLQTMVVVLTLVGSVGSLYLMRAAAKRAGVRPDVVEIDLQPDKGMKPRPDQERILKDLARSTQAGAAADKLEKNPFKFDGEAPAVPGAPVTAHDPDEERIRQLLASVQINAIMQGPTPVARVNGRLVKVGDTIDSLLLVAQINDRSVDFIAKERTYTINMGDGVLPGQGVRPPAPARPRPGFGPPPER